MKPPLALPNLSTALVYDRLTSKRGGAEYVLKVLFEYLKPTTIVTSLWRKEVTSWISGSCQVETNPLSKLPLVKSFRMTQHVADVFRGIFFENHQLTSHQLVISVASGEAKSVLTQPGQVHICYLLTPPRYLEEGSNRYILEYVPKMLWPIRKVMHIFFRWQSRFDRASSLRPQLLIPISKLVQARAQKNYPHARISQPVHPPVRSLPEEPLPQLDKILAQINYGLFVGRFVWYKKPQSVISFSHANNTPVILVGEGQQLKKLQELAGEQGYVRDSKQTVVQALKDALNHQATIVFLRHVSEHELARLYAHAAALIMPGVDDFGLTAIEALQFKTPVIINQNSGAAEVIIHQKTGYHLQSSKAIDMVKAWSFIQTWQPELELFQVTHSQFSPDTFIGEIVKRVYDCMQEAAQDEYTKSTERKYE